MVRLFAAGLVVSAVAAAGQPEFKAGTELVRVPVTVTQGGRMVAPGVLTAADFRVIEDGVPQQVTLFERESLPLSICVVFDASHSMLDGARARRAAAATRELFARLSPQDEVTLVTFADKSTLAVPWTRGADSKTIDLNVDMAGHTSLRDALKFALGVIETARNSRHAILLVTDGVDTASKASLSETVATRRQSETQVSALRMFAPTANQSSRASKGSTPFTVAPAPTAFEPAMMDGDDVLPALVGDSGGVTYTIATDSAPARAVRAFLDDLRLQYTLGYTPARALDGKYRRIKVEVNQRGIRVRHRGGYLALPAQ